jgi:GAF domain-containing protein
MNEFPEHDAQPIDNSYIGYQEILDMINSGESSRNVYSRITHESRIQTGAIISAIGLCSEDMQMLHFLAADGENLDQILGLQIRADDSFAAPILQSKRTTVLQGGFIAEAQESKKTWNAVAPILDDGKAIGVLIVMKRAEEGAYPEEYLRYLDILAKLALMAKKMEKTRLECHDANQELEVLYDTAQTISCTLNMHEVIDGVVDAVCKRLEYQSAALFLLNDERTHLFIAADRGLTEEEREIQLSSEDPLIKVILNDGQPFLIDEITDSGNMEDIPWNERSRSVMIAPVRNRNETHGLIIITSGLPAAFTRNDLRMLNAAALQAGISLSNAALYEDATRRAEEATAIYDLSTHVNSSLNLDNVFQFISDSVVNLLKVDKFALLLFDPKQNRLVPRVCFGVNEGSFQRLQPGIGEGIAGWVFEWMTPAAVSDVVADSRNRTAPIHQEGIVSTLCVPMAVGDEGMGVMLAMSSTRRLFTIAEAELLYTISNQASVAIMNSMLYNNARTKSTEMLRLIHRVARGLGAAMNKQNMPQLFADLTLEVMRAQRCTIYQVDGDSLRLYATSGFRPAVLPDEVVLVGDGLCGWVAKRSKPLSLNAMMDDPRSASHAWLMRDRLNSYLGVPLRHDRKTVGVAEIFLQESRGFTEDEIKLLAQFARQARVGATLVSL